jgi:hypothetical protein
LLAHGRWFSPGTPAPSTTKTGHHEIAEILLKVALNTKNQKSIKSFIFTVTISVNDINDNAPSFSSDRIMVEFEENKSCSNTITALSATDSDKPNSE